MSKRARRTENPVSLFPFLAVLICAMGALILLLLVTTRRIRHQQEEAVAAAVVEPVVEAPEPLSTAPPRLFPPPEMQQNELPDPPEPTPPPVDPNDEWRDRLAALQARQTELAAGVESQESSVQQLRTTIEADTHTLQNLRSETETIVERRRQLVSELERLKREEQQSSKQAIAFRREIDETRERIANADSKFTIMPYDGRTGTRRRPIILECTEEGVTFASEGVTIRFVDLIGFPPHSNPLRTTARALTKYWQRADARSANAEFRGEPYLLVVIRPRGIATYYIVRKYLDAANDSFGYELVGDEQEFVWPDTDPEAERICRTIVEQMLKEREEMLALLPPEHREHARRVIDQGVSALRKPSEEERYVTILGQRFSREPFVSRQQNLQPPQSGLSDEPDALSQQERGFDSTDGDALTGRETQSPALSDRIIPTPPPGRLPNPFLENEASASSLTAPSSSDLSNSASFPPPLPLNSKLRPWEQSEGSSKSHEPSWQRHVRSGNIGYEREVLIRVSSTQVTVADETSFPITQGISADELRQLLSVHMSQHVLSWGEPPRSFYWLPSVKFMVSPGGNQFYERLRPIVGKWELRHEVEHTLD